MKSTCVWCGERGSMERHASVVWGSLRSTWYRCSSCDSLQVLPLPSARAIQRVYEDDYLNKRLQPHVGVDCRKRYAASYRPTVFKEYEWSLTDLKIQPRIIRSVLDVGCADGVFLDFARAYFSRATRLVGTDISETLLSKARRKGWSVFPASELSVHGGRYDLITLWDVLEHTPEPFAMMRQLVPLLTPHGSLMIQTPRVGDVAQLFGETWPHLLPVQHLSLASKDGMAALAKRSELSITCHISFGANAPSEKVPQPYKRYYDQLAKKFDFGEVQLVRLTRY